MISGGRELWESAGQPFCTAPQAQGQTALPRRGLPARHGQLPPICTPSDWLQEAWVASWLSLSVDPRNNRSPALVCSSYLQLRWGASRPWRSTWTSWSKWTWWTSPIRRPWTFSWTQAQGQTRGSWRLQYRVSRPVSEFLKHTHTTLVMSWDATRGLLWGACLQCSQLDIWI